MKLRVDWSIVTELVRKGVPMGVQVLVISFSTVLMMVLVNRFGVDTAAAYAALLQLWAYLQMPVLAIAAAVETMTAQNIGAQKWGRIRAIARVGVICCILLTSAIVTLVYAIDQYAYGLFLPAESAALLIASHISSIVTWSFVLVSIPLALFGVMRASGAVIAPLVVYTVSLFVLRFSLAAWLVDQWQAEAIWWSFPISSAAAVVLAGLYYQYGAWHKLARPRIIAPVESERVPLRAERDQFSDLTAVIDDERRNELI